MPKLIDHQQKQQQIIQAVIRLISQEDIRAVSIRNVARVAGMKQSTLRNYMATYDAMLEATFCYVRDRQRCRIERVLASVAPQELPVALLLETLPIDEARQQETRIWLALCVSKPTATIRQIIEDINQGMLYACRAVMQRYLPGGGSHAQEVAAQALRAFVDGLALGMLQQPTALTAQRAEQLIRCYLAALR